MFFRIKNVEGIKLENADQESPLILGSIHRSFNLYFLPTSPGPVRGIDFHKQQPLFVSGGDDYKIKVQRVHHDRK